MSMTALTALCAQAADAIGHARSLFGDPSPSDAADQSSAALHQSAHITTAAGSRTDGSSGAGIDAYRRFNIGAATDLTAVAQSDTAVSAHMQHAAAVVQAGAARLDAIAEENRATTLQAQQARTPADQAAIARVLRSQISRTQQVVSDTQQQAAGIASGIQAVDYKTAPPSAPPPPAPGPPPAPLQGAPDPLRDFTQDQLQGRPVPNPPAPQVSADELRLRLMQQRIDYNDFVEWFNKTYGGTTSPEAMLEKIATFDGATLVLGGSLVTLPEGIPGTVAAAIGWLISGYDLATADPGTAHVPELGH